MAVPTGKPFGDFDLGGFDLNKVTQRAAQEEHNRRVKFLTDKAKAEKAAKEAQEQQGGDA
jgi:hypothetical protein